MKTVKIFSLAFPSSLSSVDSGSYLHIRDVIPDPENKILLFQKCGVVSTDTYHNFWPIKKLFSLTNVEFLTVHISGQGKFLIEIFSVVDDDFYITEKCELSKIIKLGEGYQFKFDIKEGQGLAYVRITSLEDNNYIDSIELLGNLQELNKIRVSCNICTFNRQSYVKNFVENVASSFLNNDKILFRIVNNGNELGFLLPSNCEVVKNKNTGGAGGFSRGMQLSIQDPLVTHILLADDDIRLDKEVIERTLAFLSIVKKEFSDCFISGAMLSLDEPWLQYERNSSLSNKGFQPRGSNLDTCRDRIGVIKDISANPAKGLAGWWYVVMPSKVVKEYGMPLQIFVRGDDVEYSLRCNRQNISINGICVWHEPFCKKYNEIMEDYYLVRNMLLISYEFSQNYGQLNKVFFVRKFLKNLLIFDYVAAEFNLLAANHLLDGTFKTDPEQLHKQLMQQLKDKLKGVTQWEGEKVVVYDKYSSKARKLFYIFLQHVFGLRKGTGLSYGGFARRIGNFVGCSKVVTYQGGGKFREYRFSWKKSSKLLLRFLITSFLLGKNRDKLSESALEFRKGFQSEIKQG